MNITAYQIMAINNNMLKTEKGYAMETTEPLCAIWAILGTFTPFYCNHQSVSTIEHRFYRFPIIAQAAKKPSILVDS